jgi:hypothetical protein
MSSECYTLWKIPTVRVTKLNSCGQPITGCSTVVSNGIISVAMTKEYEARQEFFIKNGDGTFCVKKTNPPILKWINIVATFCGVDPEMVNIMSAEPLVNDDSSSAVATGYSTQEDSASSANFALEMWTRLASVSNGAPCSGSEYGYVLLPWVVEGTVGDLTLENGAANFILNARTSSGSLWGTGPYNIDLSDASGTLNNHIPLLTAIGATQHARQLTVRLTPPTAACGCTTLSSLTPSN